MIQSSYVPHTSNALFQSTTYSKRLTTKEKTKKLKVKSVGDPDLDTVCSYIVDSGMSLLQIEELTEKNGWKVSRYTMCLWLYGQTMQPRNMTLTAVMRALGYNRQWVKVSN